MLMLMLVLMLTLMPMLILNVSHFRGGRWSHLLLPTTTLRR